MQTFQIRFLSLSQAQSWFEYHFFLELITNLQFRHQARSNYYCFRLYQGKCRERFFWLRPTNPPQGSRGKSSSCECLHISECVVPVPTCGWVWERPDIFFSHFDEITFFFIYLYIGLLVRLFFGKTTDNICGVGSSCHTPQHIPLMPSPEFQEETSSFNYKIILHGIESIFLMLLKLWAFWSTRPIHYAVTSFYLLAHLLICLMMKMVNRHLNTGSFYCLCINESQHVTMEQYVGSENLSL